jgi:dihydropteroate synthase
VAESGIPAAEELRRIIPVIEDVLRERPNAVLSVDTYKAEVARAAVSAGCEIVNDVSALRWDEQMAPAVVALACGVILMHTRGRPQEWRNLPPAADILAEVKRDLRAYSAKSSIRTIPCWPVSTSSMNWASRCLWERHGNLSSAARWPMTDKTPQPTSVCTVRSPQ